MAQGPGGDGADCRRRARRSPRDGHKSESGQPCRVSKTQVGRGKRHVLGAGQGVLHARDI